MDDLIREMITAPRAGSADRSRRSRLVATALTVGLASIGVTTLTTGALFTDTDTMSATDFTTGTVVISPAMSTTVALGAPNMAPGDTSFGAVTVTNSGTLEQRYGVSIAAANATAVNLAGELELDMYAVASEASCSAAGVAALTPLASLTAVPTMLTQIIGDTSPGAQAGDRTLGSTVAETLCVRVHLPVGTDNTFQGANTEISLTFDAEQTANNA